MISTRGGALQVEGNIPREEAGVIRMLEGLRRTIDGFWYVYYTDDDGRRKIEYDLQGGRNGKICTYNDPSDVRAELPLGLWCLSEDIFLITPGSSGWLQSLGYFLRRIRQSELLAPNLGVRNVIEVNSCGALIPGFKAIVQAFGRYDFLDQATERGSGDATRAIEAHTVAQIRANMVLFALNEPLPNEIKEALADGP